MRAGTSVYGLRETLATLRESDRKLYFAAIAKMKKAAKPIAAGIDSRFPSSSPFAGRRRDGWTHNGRTSWTNRKRAAVKYGGRRYRSGDREWPLLRVMVTDVPGELYDMAGRGNLAAQLGGAPSRAVWKDRAGIEAASARALEAAAEETMRYLNRKLATRGRV